MGKKTTEAFQLTCVDAVPPPSDGALVAALLAVCNEDPFECLSGRGAGSAISSARIDAIRPRFQGLLATAAKDREGLASSFLPEVGIPLIRSLKMKPAIVFGTRGFTLGHRLKFGRLETVLDYAVLLLLDAGKPYGAALCRCRLLSCQRFYLAERNPKGGPANRNYCTPEHRFESHNRKENRTPRKHK